MENLCKFVPSPFGQLLLKTCGRSAGQEAVVALVILDRHLMCLQKAPHLGPQVTLSCSDLHLSPLAQVEDES